MGALSALDPPPPDVNLDEDRCLTIIVTSAVTWALAFVSVVLRLVSRHIKGVDLWWDDWFIIASLVRSSRSNERGRNKLQWLTSHDRFLLVLMSLTWPDIVLVSHGLGRHIWVAPPDAYYAWAIGLFVAELCYFVTLVCVKWSILAFYWRTFNIRQSIKLPIWILATVVGLWGVCVVLVTLFQCQPINAWWDRFNLVDPMLQSQYHCGVELKQFPYGNAITTIVTDLAMLVLPSPYVWNLQLPWVQKLALVGIFLVGLFVTVVSVVRLNYLLHLDITGQDVTWNIVDAGLWSILEGNIAIFCACLPFLLPVVQKLTVSLCTSIVPSRRQQQPRSRTLRHSHHCKEPWGNSGEGGHFGTTSSAHGWRYSTQETDEHPLACLTDDGQSDQSVAVKRNASGRRTSPIVGIRATRDIHVQYEIA